MIQLLMTSFSGLFFFTSFVNDVWTSFCSLELAIVDFTTMFFLILTAIMFFTIFLSSFSYLSNCLLMLLFVDLTLLFMTKCWIMFFIYFELAVVLTSLLMILMGSQPERLLASSYFLVYSTIGSFPLLLKILKWEKKMQKGEWFNKVPLSAQKKAFLEFFSEKTLYICMLYLGFLLKLPMYGGHLWLPKAHVEAPVYGSMLLAAILLKIGVYGMLRTGFFSFMNLSFNILLGWGLASIIMSGLICFRVKDIKSMMAYSSMAHMKLMVPLLALPNKSVKWAFIMLSMGHGFVSKALFLGFKNFYLYSSTRSVLLNSGTNNVFWVSSALWFSICIANSSFPGSLNSFSEYSMIVNLVSFTKSKIKSGLLLLKVLISGLFSIYLYMLVSWGKTKKKYVSVNSYNSFMCLFLSGFFTYVSFFLM